MRSAGLVSRTCPCGPSRGDIGRVRLMKLHVQPRPQPRDCGTGKVVRMNLSHLGAPVSAMFFRLEQAAFASGIPMPEPVSADAEVLVHRWVDGSKVPEEPARASFGFEIGEILASLHSLDIEWTH